MKDVELVYLPPYSPFLNPIEMIFGVWKFVWQAEFNCSLSAGSISSVLQPDSEHRNRVTVAVDPSKTLSSIQDLISSIASICGRISRKTCYGEFQKQYEAARPLSHGKGYCKPTDL
jgi:hypothetical protein